MFITREGDIPTDKSKICIIKQGECKILSDRVPMKLNEQSKARKKKAKHDFVNLKGYFSQTTNSLQISLIGENHWIGDEALVIDEGQPYPFSVITSSRVVVYEITREDLLQKLPKDVTHVLKRNCRKKLNFLQDRVMNICKSVSEVAKWDNFHNEYSARVTEVSRLFSQASRPAVNNLK